MKKLAVEVLVLLAAAASVDCILSPADMGKILADQAFVQKIPDYKEDFPDFHLYFTNTVTDSIVIPAFHLSNCTVFWSPGTFTVFFEQFSSSMAWHASYDVNFGAQYGSAKGDLTANSNRLSIQFEADVHAGGKLSAKTWNYCDMRPVNITLTGFHLEPMRHLMNHYVTKTFTDAYSAAILTAEATLMDKINSEGIGYYLCPS